MIAPIKNSTTIATSEINVCILFNGNITITKNGINNSVKPKSFFFFDTPFDIIATSPFVVGYIAKLDADFLKNFPDIEALSKEVTNYFEIEKFKNVDSKKNTVQSILDAKGKRRLVESYTHILWTELLNDFIAGKKEQSIIEQFSNLIDQNIDQNYCAGTYAEMLDIPLKRLIREVKKSENKTPCNFIYEKVVEKAKYKLLQSNDTSQMIAYQLGFQDPYYFIKYFKRNTTLTPTQYRLQHS